MRVVLGSNFLDALMEGSELLTPGKCKFMLQDMARSSPLMGLDSNSMNRIWHLVTVIHKWQMHLTRHPHHLMDVTFRHLESIKSSLYANLNNADSELVLLTKERLLKFWNSFSDFGQESTYVTVKVWLSSITGKASLLVRLGFQSANDGTFLTNGKQQHFPQFRDNIGENIYAKCAQLFQQQIGLSPLSSEGKCIQQLENMLQLGNLSQISQSEISPYQLKFNFTNESGENDSEEQQNLCPTTYNKSLLKNYFE